MRLSLLLICLFSLVGGCAASSSHGVVVPKIVSCSGKQQPVAAVIAAVVKQHAADAGSPAFYVEADDMEDDEELDHLFIRKCKVPVRYIDAYTQSLTVNSLRCCRLSVASMLGNSSPRYIAQQVFRV